MLISFQWLDVDGEMVESFCIWKFKTIAAVPLTVQPRTSDTDIDVLLAEVPEGSCQNCLQSTRNQGEYYSTFTFLVKYCKPLMSVTLTINRVICSTALHALDRDWLSLLLGRLL